MKPKALNEKDWNKMLRKYHVLSLKSWNYLDGVKKLSILRGANIKIDYFPIFKTHNVSYPESIYNFEKCKKIVLPPSILSQLKRIALEDRKEIGGTIDEKQNVKFLFVGNDNRIDLNVEENSKIITLFHTHPEDEDVEFDPPSVLDIVSFLSFNIKSIADLVISQTMGDLLKVQNCIVFTKNELYVYYFSKDLVVNIVKYLLDLYKKEDFVFEVEKLLEEVEIYYSFLLSRFNMTMTNEQIEEYLTFLHSLGIIIKRFSYLSQPEYYIF